jgi:hypothetical protein
MRRKFNCLYLSPVTGKKETGIVEAFFMKSHDLKSQVEVYFETRIAPLSTLISFKETDCVLKPRNSM